MFLCCCGIDGIRVLLQQKAHNIYVPIKTSKMQRQPAAIASRCSLSAILEQKLHREHLSISSGNMQRRSTVTRLRFDVRSILQQQLSAVDIAAFCHYVQWRLVTIFFQRCAIDGVGILSQ